MNFWLSVFIDRNCKDLPQANFKVGEEVTILASQWHGRVPVTVYALSDTGDGIEYAVGYNKNMIIPKLFWENELEKING
jgi:hypothetical protein